MFALYLSSMTLSAGVFGLFLRQILQSEGYVPGLHAGIAAAVGAALLYAAAQLGFMAFVQLLKPTRSSGPFFCEALSHAAVLVLLPHIVGLAMPWPHDVFLRVEPLLYFGGFFGVHAFFKLMTFFAAMRGAPASRIRFAGWSFAGVMAVALAAIAAASWVDDVQALRPRLEPSAGIHELHGVRCQAAEVREGAILESSLDAGDGAAITFRVAAPPDETETGNRRAYIDVYLFGAQTKRYGTSLRLADARQGWATVRVPQDFVPARIRHCEIVWSSRQESKFRKIIGLRPVQTSNQALFISGPYVHDARSSTDEPSVVIVSIEGLGSAHMGTFGYRKDTTPALDRFVARSLAFSNTYTPYPSATPATWSALSGTSPLTHRRFPDTPPTESPPVVLLSDMLARKGYTTAAFTERNADRSAVFDEALESGFEFVDVAYRAGTGSDDRLAGSRGTLARAQAWIEQNRDVAFFAFIRLHELGAMRVEAHHGETLQPERARTQLEVYDGLLRYLDEHVGRFFQYLRDHDTRNYTIVTLTSPYAIDFNAGTNAPSVGLSENSLRVPLVFQTPLITPEKRTTFVSLTDLTPTILELTGVAEPATFEGHSVLATDYALEPVSMYGDPLEMILRTERYQFVWQSGLSPQTLQPVVPDAVLGLLQVTRKEATYTTRDVASRNPKLVAQFRDKLAAYAQVPGSTAP